MHILEIGPGEDGPTFPGSFTVDSVARKHITNVATWGTDNLPFEDGVFQYIYTSHVLEHVPWYKTKSALDEVYRVLAPSGKFEVWVPDFRKLVSVYLSGDFFQEDWTPLNDEREPMKWLAGRMFCGTRLEEESSWHRAVFDEAYLRRCLEGSGFKDVVRLEDQPPEQRVNHKFINLGMSGIK